MEFKWEERAAALAADAQAVKVLAVTDAQGIPHTILDDSISLDEAGRIVYLEFVETSPRNASLVHSLWFSRAVTLHVKKGDEEYEITGRVERSVVSGPLFERCYREAIEKDPQADLSTVWLIRPEAAADVSYRALLETEHTEHPLVMHLDHLAR